MSKSVFVQVVPCTRAVGDLVAGILLHRILFHYHHTKVERDGFKWLAKSREQWAEDANLTHKQLTRALKLLDDGNWIVREQHKFGHSTPVFIRPTDRSIGIGHAYLSPTGHAQVCPEEHTLIKKNHRKKNRKESAHSACSGEHAVSGSGKTDPEENLKTEEESKTEVQVTPTPEETMSSVADLANKFKNLPPKKIDLMKPDKVETLVEVWRQGLKDTGHQPPAITMKIRGQLKHLIKALPEGKAPIIVAYAIANWGDVTWQAEKDAGAFKSPSVPEIGYLLKYQHIAVDLWSKHEKNAQTVKASKEKAPFVQSIAKPVPVHKKATLEEILAIEKEAGL